MLPIHDFAFDTNKRDIMPWSASIFVGLLGTEIWNLNAKIRKAKAERRESALKNNTLSDFQSPSGWSQSVSVCVLLSLFECVCVWVQTAENTYPHTHTRAHTHTHTHTHGQAHTYGTGKCVHFRCQCQKQQWGSISPTFARRDFDEKSRSWRCQSTSETCVSLAMAAWHDGQWGQPILNINNWLDEKLHFVYFYAE